MSERDLTDLRRRGLAYVAAQQQGGLKAVETALKENALSTCRWHFSHPINEHADTQAALDAFWRPLFGAFPDLTRRDDIFVTGHFDDRDWLACTGHFVGTFHAPWLNIPPTDQLTFIRFAELNAYDGDRIERSYMLLDLIGLARQAGIDLIAKSRGAEIIAPGPAAQDGLRLTDSDPGETEKSLTLVNAMIEGLMSYDRTSLKSMHQTDFWTPDMLWYGPSGIGATRGLGGFERYHQQPFLNFVPDRVGGDHVTRFADGPYAASAGWPSIRATTSGEPWIDMPVPSGLPVTMRVVDFWRRSGNRFAENWVFVDIPDLFLQCGIDIFEALTPTQ
ncbi:MAG: ester cyclase [Pseudomonadota bacterium]